MADNTASVQKGSSGQVQYPESKTIHDTSTFIHDHWQKLVTVLLLIFASLWFYNEYKTNQVIRSEQASYGFSKASELLLSIILNESSLDKSGDIERFQNETEILLNEYSDTTYGQMAKGLNSVFLLYKSDSEQQSIDINVDDLKEDLLMLDADLQSEPTRKIVSELKLLMYGRYLLESQIPEQKLLGISYLKALINQADFFPIEAAISYYISMEKTEETQAEFKELMDSLVIRYPQVEDDLIDEFAKLGISLALNND